MKKSIFIACMIMGLFVSPSQAKPSSAGKVFSKAAYKTATNLKNNLASLKKSLKTLNTQVASSITTLNGLDGKLGSFTAASSLKDAVTGVDGKLGSFTTASGSTLKDALSGMDNKLGGFTAASGSTLKDSVDNIKANALAAATNSNNIGLGLPAATYTGSTVPTLVAPTA